MDHFAYRDGTLFAEEVAVAEIAEAVGTPFYCYSTATLQRHFTVLDSALGKAGLDDRLICYSVKANSNLAVIATLAKLGAGADIVSQGEMLRAVEAGIAPQKIVFSGVGKTAAEMRAALSVGRSKPSACAVAWRSIGKPVPASAAAPSGLSFIRRRASASRPWSRASIST